MFRRSMRSTAQFLIIFTLALMVGVVSTYTPALADETQSSQESQVAQLNIWESTYYVDFDLYYAYTGEPIIPTLTLKNSSTGATLVKGTDYTLSCTNNTNPGTATATVTGIGRYTGSFNLVFRIVKSFPDVSASTPHYMEILWLTDMGITRGYEDGTFRGMTPVYRQDMAAFLYRLAGEPEYTPTSADKARFKDVTEDTPHAKEIWWLGSTGIAEGYEDGTFRGMTPVYRQDMAAFLYRFSSATTYVPTEADKKLFKDVTEDTPHANEIWWMGAMGISEGYEDGTYRGMWPVYRQDMAAFLFRIGSDLGRG